MIWSYFLQPPTWVTWSESPAANLKSSSQGAGPPSSYSIIIFLVLIMMIVVLIVIMMMVMTIMKVIYSLVMCFFTFDF